MNINQMFIQLFLRRLKIGSLDVANGDNDRLRRQASRLLEPLIARIPGRIFRPVSRIALTKFNNNFF